MTTALSDRLRTQQAGQSIDTQQGKNQIVLALQDDKFRRQVTNVLPKGLSYQRFLQLLFQAVRANPDLLGCTKESFVGAVMEMAELGLEPGPLSYGYLVPIPDTRNGVVNAEFWLGYRGMIQLAYRGHEVINFDLQTVREGDEFEHRLGTNPSIHHLPLLGNEDATAIAWYAAAQLRSGPWRFQVLGPPGVEKYRKRARGADSARSPWKTDFDAMARKTCARRLFPTLPISPEIMAVVERDSRREMGISEPEIGPEIKLEIPEGTRAAAGDGDGGEQPQSQPQAGQGDGLPLEQK